MGDPHVTAWTWALGEPAPSMRMLRELTAATGRRITERVDAPWDAQFSIDGRHDEALAIVELETDLHVWRDGVHIFRGRIGPSSDDIDENGHRCQFSALDYRSMITKHRVVGPLGAHYGPGVDQAVIAGLLINDSMLLPGGQWGIVSGVGATSGVLRENTLDPGKPVGEAIAEMARLDNGFEWDIDADLKFNRWYPQRGADNGVVADYGGLLTHVSRRLDDTFANAVTVTGAQGLTPVVYTSPTIASDLRGRMESFAGYPSIVVQTTLDAKAPWQLAQASVLRPALSITFAPGRWEGPDHVGLGDTIRLAVNSGRLTVNTAHRVVELALQPADDGTESIVAGLQAV